MAKTTGVLPADECVVPDRYDHASRPLRAGFWRQACAVLCAVALAVPFSPQPATAFFGGDRTLTLYHAHTKESITVTYKRGGSFDNKALEQLNWFLRDWRRDEPIRMDPRLFDVLWEVYQDTGASSPITIVSAYRAPETNGMLRRRSRAVAKHSQHMLGKAMDFHLPGVSIDKIRAIGVKMQRGGVGYYPSANTPFIHLDVGSVRAWPRLTPEYLARLFPDGKTVHVPSNGKPLPGYDLARAEILSRGGSVMGYSSGGEEEESPSGGSGKSLFAALFGGDEDEDVAEIVSPQPRGRRSTRGGSQVASSAHSSSGNESAASFFVAEAARSGGAVEPVAQQQPAMSAPLESLIPAPEPELPRLAPIPPPRSFAFAEMDIPNASESDRGGEGASRGFIGPSAFSGPLPPPRPDFEADVAQPPVVAAVASAPLPPVRPAAFAMTGSSADGATEEVTARQEPQVAALPARSQAPLPPSRPDFGDSASARPATASAFAADPGHTGHESPAQTNRPHPQPVAAPVPATSQAVTASGHVPTGQSGPSVTPQRPILPTQPANAAHATAVIYGREAAYNTQLSTKRSQGTNGLGATLE